jgi:Ni/Co efflux regulator RcnB
MKTLIAAAISMSLLAGAVTPAYADNRDHDRREWHHDNDRRDDRHDDHRWSNRNQDRGRSDARDYRHAYVDGRRDQYRYDAPRYDYSAPRYIAPRGYYVQTWHRGDRLPAEYCNDRYVVRDYGSYRLQAPPRGHHWVRVNNDVLLTAVATGAVVAVVSGLFH